jgi:phosphomannomutase
VIGGEGNGGAIDPRVVYVRESFAGMALVLDAMAERNMTVSTLAGELPRYEIYKTKVAASREKIPAMFEALERQFSEASPDRLDGLRLDWPGAQGQWLLVRASNTEPIIRIIAEAPTAHESRRLCDTAIQAMQGV